MVQPGTLFEYLAAFITIILAIALGDLVMSLHCLLRARRRVQWHPIPLLAALWVMLAILTFFFSLWDLTSLDSLTYYELIWKLLPTIFYFLGACAALPDEVPPEGLDLYAFYLEERRYLYTVLACGFALDVADAAFAYWDYYVNDPSFALSYTLLNLGSFLAMGVLAWSARLHMQWAGLVLLFIIAHLGFSTWVVHGAAAIAPAS